MIRLMLELDLTFLDASSGLRLITALLHAAFHSMIANIYVSSSRIRIAGLVPIPPPRVGRPFQWLTEASLRS